MQLELLTDDHFWYLVGLIASDGCLSADGRHIDITAKDYDYLHEIKVLCNIDVRIGRKSNGRGDYSHRLQIGSKRLYDRLQEIGLTPKKSKTISSLKVPHEQFHNFLRGEIDGDGCIRKWTHPSNGKEQWSLRIVSASKPFLDWIKEECERVLGAKGRIYSDNSSGLKYVLKYGKLAAQVVLKQCYDGANLALQRKKKLAFECINAQLRWKRSKTIEDCPGGGMADTRDSGSGSPSR